MQAMRLKEILETDMIVRLDVEDNLLSVGSEFIPNLITINLNDTMEHKHQHHQTQVRMTCLFEHKK